MMKAVLLDLDGTLIDSNAAHAATWSAASRLHGYDYPDSFFQPLIGMGGDRVFARMDVDLSEDRDTGKAIMEKRAELFKTTYLPKLKATRGARALVAHLYAQNVRCIVASSTKASDLEALLGVAGVGEFIFASTTSDDAKQSKPAADIVRVALWKGGVEATEAVMIGDTPYDIESATGAGIDTIALRCGGWSDADLTGALEIYDDPADLLEHYATSAIHAGRDAESGNALRR